VDASALRDEFPVLQRLAYLNTGTNGPLAARAVEAARHELDREAKDGRTPASFERRAELSAELRAGYASALGCDPGDVALTTSTSDGVSQTLAGLALGAGDEVLTSDEEHPGLLGALSAIREVNGVSIREAPLSDLADAVGPRTSLVACSHVGWMSGVSAPAELAELEIPVLLDGAQGLGAVAVDVHALGCDAYAGSGQKWLCGPDGTGALYVSPSLRERMVVPRRSYVNLEDPNAGLDAHPHADARRYDAMLLSAGTLACARAGLGALEAAGLRAIHERAGSLADRLAGLLADSGREIAPRSATTLVSFASADPPAERMRLAEQGVVVRDIPGRPWLRASVGAWNNEEDLARLLEALSV
jgi:selenocysteine lyase/cysteine desulfurase